jgi:hypothetical protein
LIPPVFAQKLGENLLMEEQRRKIENLEARMKKLEDALAV